MNNKPAALDGGKSKAGVVSGSDQLCLDLEGARHNTTDAPAPEPAGHPISPDGPNPQTKQATDDELRQLLEALSERALSKYPIKEIEIGTIIADESLQSRAKLNED